MQPVRCFPCWFFSALSGNFRAKGRKPGSNTESNVYRQGERLGVNTCIPTQTVGVADETLSTLQFQLCSNLQQTILVCKLHKVVTRYVPGRGNPICRFWLVHSEENTFDGVPKQKAAWIRSCSSDNATKSIAPHQIAGGQPGLTCVGNLKLSTSCGLRTSPRFFQAHLRREADLPHCLDHLCCTAPSFW